jgi:ribosomal protein L44E
MEGVNLTKIYCKHFCKYHNVPPVQEQYDNKNKILKRRLDRKKEQFGWK